MKQGCGIVLQKLFPQRYAICLFDRHEGKKIAIPSTEDICLGALLEYQIHPTRTSWRIRHITPLALPTAHDTQELLFIHHALELCYQILPLDYRAPDIFSLMMLLYDKPAWLTNRKGHLIFVAKLLMMLGVYPHEDTLSPLIMQILRTPIDNLATGAIHLESENELSAWVYASIAGHPCVKYLKTVSFLPESICI